MSIYVDRPDHAAHGRLWAHLVSDTSTEELHTFAARLGVPRRAFEGDHYDVPADLLARAVHLGAHQVDTRRIIRLLVDAGLRTPKRRGEKVVATTGAGLRRVDVVRCGHLPESVARHVILTDDGVRHQDRAPVQSEVRLLGFRRSWDHDGTTRHVEHEAVWTLGTPPSVMRDPGTSNGARPDPEVWWAPLLEP